MSSSSGPNRGPRRTALIVGGTKGIGLAIAKRFAQAGYDLILNYHSDSDAADRAAAEFPAHGPSVQVIQADVGSMNGARDLIEAVRKRTGNLSALVHSSAIPAPGYLAEQAIEDVERAVNVGGMSLLYLVQAANDLLGSGSRVIFLSGVSIDLVLPRHGALAAGKALGECLLRYLAIEFAARGVTFNTLRVGPIDTGLFRAAVAAAGAPGMSPPVTPNGRQLTAEDVAEFALFMASPESAMMQGQTVTVDGGLSTTVRAR